MFIPIKIVITKKCPRCNLRYPEKENQCTHCSNLTEQEVEELKIRYKEEQRGNANLGGLFLFFGVLIAIGVLLF